MQKEEIGQPNNETSKTSDLETLELKANLNSEQRAYLEVLKDKMKKVLRGKTKQELAKAGDLESLNKYKTILVEILEFLRTKNIRVKHSEIIDDPEIIKRQLALIDDSLAPFKNKIKDRRLYDALLSQKQAVIQSSEMKTRIWPKSEVKIYAEDILSERQVWEEIKKREKIDDVHLFLNEKVLDENGNLLYLNLGIPGKPDIDLVYYLAGEFKNYDGTMSNKDKTIIGKYPGFRVHFFSPSKYSVDVTATYNEQKHVWEPEINNS